MTVREMVILVLLLAGVLAGAVVRSVRKGNAPADTSGDRPPAVAQPAVTP